MYREYLSMLIGMCRAYSLQINHVCDMGKVSVSRKEVRVRSKGIDYRYIVKEGTEVIDSDYQEHKVRETVTLLLKDCYESHRHLESGKFPVKIKKRKNSFQDLLTSKW